MRACRRSSSIRISPTPASSSDVAHSAHRLDARRPRRSRARRPPRRPRTTSGQPSRSERGTLASTNTSWIFFDRPASRSPGRQPRTIRPGSSERMRQPPQLDLAARARPGRCSSQSRSCSRTAWTPPPRSTRREPAGASSSSASAGGSVAPRLEAAQDVLARGRVDPLEQRQDLVADQPAHGAGVRRVDAGRRRPRSRQKASVSSRQSGSSGRTTPSSRRALIPLRVPARHEPVEDRLDLVARGVAGRAQRARALRVAERRAAPPRSRPAPSARTTSAPSSSAQKRASAVRLGAAQPVVDVERRDAVAELAEREGEAGRVGAARDEAEHLAAGLDQLVAADVRLDPREQRPSAEVSHSPVRARRASPRARGDRRSSSSRARTGRASRTRRAARAGRGGCPPPPRARRRSAASGRRRGSPPRGGRAGSRNAARVARDELAARLSPPPGGAARRGRRAAQARYSSSGAPS